MVEVAVGILLREMRYALMGKRPDGKPYAGYWEFPGGKLEPKESVVEALRRELQEELGIEISIEQAHCHELITIEHDYPHASVRLHVCLVDRWQGEPRGLEQQELFWHDLLNPSMTVEPVLPAAWPMIERLQQHIIQKS
jgi:8-oxo-dGTP diphosphatase